MANKFQKSVLERLEAEEKRQKQSKPAATKAPPKKEKKLSDFLAEEATAQPEVAPVSSPSAPDVSAISAEAAAAENAPKFVPENAPKIPSNTAPEQKATAPDLSAYLIPEAQRVAKNKTFYLDAAVIDRVKQAAKEQGVTDSRLVNDILRHVLGL